MKACSTLLSGKLSAQRATFGRGPLSASPDLTLDRSTPDLAPLIVSAKRHDMQKLTAIA